MFYGVCAILVVSAAVFVSVLCTEEKAPNETLSVSNVNASSTTPHPGDSKIGGEPPKPIGAPPASGREGVPATRVTQKSVEDLNNTLSTTTTTTTTASPVSKPNNATTDVSNETATSNSSIKPPSKISPRKGVTIPEPLRVKKPTITENSDDDLLQPDPKPSKINANEQATDNSKEHKRAAYLIPIIAVIFSVPLVAVVISVLYKRGSEWWQHRHYRRMDFLIEGMYNN